MEKTTYQGAVKTIQNERELFLALRQVCLSNEERSEGRQALLSYLDSSQPQVASIDQGNGTAILAFSLGFFKRDRKRLILAAVVLGAVILAFAYWGMISAANISVGFF